MIDERAIGLGEHSIGVTADRPQRRPQFVPQAGDGCLDVARLARHVEPGEQAHRTAERSLYRLHGCSVNRQPQAIRISIPSG